MFDVVYRVVAVVVTACLFALASVKMLGAMQQSGYKNGVFMRWLRRKDNLQFNRLAVSALCLALASAVFSLCFSFLGVKWGLLISALPFLTLCIVYLYADKKYALKVPVKFTGRARRLLAVYLLVVACVGYGIVALLGFLSELNGSDLYASVAYVPYAAMPLLLPLLLCLSNGITGIFENARNKKFVKRAGQVLNEKEIIRVGVVGSYGKTSVKNILATVLAEKYAVAATPESYNTPMGIAKTVFSPEFAGKQILIAEMGARKKGDIAELCALVKPDYAVFTGVCEQHIETFGSLENVFAEKSEILKCGAKKVVCGESLVAFGVAESENVVLCKGARDVKLSLTGTEFVLSVGGAEIKVKTSLLGGSAAEDIALSATLAFEMGLTVEEIERGLEKVQPVPHRLQLIENGGMYILDDGYNCNPRGAKEALAVLGAHGGRKCVVTPGIVECGILQEKVNGELGEELAKADLDKVILVGQTLIGSVKNGYLSAGGDGEKLVAVKTLDEAKEALSGWTQAGDAVLFLNDLPDVY